MGYGEFPILWGFLGLEYTNFVFYMRLDVKMYIKQSFFSSIVVFFYKDSSIVIYYEYII
jgi:hypothetical protein